MDKNSLAYKATYKLSYGCSFVFFRLIKFIFVTFWKGTVKTAMQNMVVAIIYGALILGIVLSFFFSVAFFKLLTTAFVLMGFTLGVYGHIKEYPERKQRKYFFELFEQIGMKSPEGYLPYYEYDKKESPYIHLISFTTLIPLNIWQNKQDEIEMRMNVKLLDIQQDQTDKRKVNLLVQSSELPTQLYWTDESIFNYDNILAIGESCWGTVGINLGKHPHTFIAGETGSGKSNILKCLIHQALLKEYDVILIDFKRGVSFSEFSHVVDIYFDYDVVARVLQDMVKETMVRLDKFRENKVDNLNDYNRVSSEFLHRKIIFIDELAELLKVRDKELSHTLTDSIETLTRLSRAVGIHLIMGIQRPDSTVVSGQIKNNVSYRICGRFVDKEPSRIMLGNTMASELPNIKGRFIVKDNSLLEVQCFFFIKPFEVQYPKINHTSTITVEEEKADTIQETPVSVISETAPPTLTNELNFNFGDIDLTSK